MLRMYWFRLGYSATPPIIEFAIRHVRRILPKLHTTARRFHHRDFITTDRGNWRKNKRPTRSWRRLVWLETCKSWNSSWDLVALQFSSWWGVQTDKNQSKSLDVFSEWYGLRGIFDGQCQDHFGIPPFYRRTHETQAFSWNYIEKDEKGPLLWHHLK